MKKEDIEKQLKQKREQLKLAVERHEFIEQYELYQDIQQLLKARDAADRQMVL